MYASKQTKILTLKDDDGADVPVLIRKLSASQLRKAGKARHKQHLEEARDLGPELIEALRDATAKEATGDRYDQYDRELVLAFGVKEWGGRKVGEDGVLAEIGGEKYSLGDLDEETADQVYRELVDLSAPTKEQAEALEEKG